MTAISKYSFRAGAVLAGLGIWGLVTAFPATAQSDLNARLLRLERDMRDIQAETFRRQGSTLPPAGAAAVPQFAGPAAPDLDPLMRRLDEVQEGIRRLTGEMEELGHRVDQLAQQQERMQKDLDYQARQASSAGGDFNTPGEPGDTLASATPPPNPNAPILRPYAPGPRVLGQIPAGTPLPTPERPLFQGTGRASPAGDTKEEFDSAMNLLSRAQYDQARDAFRSFVDAHPDDERASAALYWTGDIAFSAKKDYTEAARDFAELLKRYPDAQRAPEGMLKLGLALFELGQMTEGCAALAALPAKYPKAATAIATRARNERRDNKC